MNKQPSIFIAVYTRDIKQYCDVDFFNTLNSLEYPNIFLSVVDNSHPDSNYPTKLGKTLKSIYHKPYNFTHIDIENREDYETLPLRSITESVNLLRDEFLNGDYDYFLIFEADVCPTNTKCIDDLLEAAELYDIVGGIYYENFHNPEYFEESHREILPTHHVLSGCALFTRKVIENIPFRYDPKNLPAFPDAIICFDASRQGYTLANTTKVKCRHLHDKYGSRGWDDGSIFI